VLNGEQSSAKSTLARILRLMIDPQACPALALPNSTENLMATAVNGWLLVYENISAIAHWLSDCVCQLAFGGGFASRTLFTNDERSVIYAQRPMICAIGRSSCTYPQSRANAVGPRGRFGRHFAPTIRGSWAAWSTRSSADCASCRRSI
jgi:hypothetical protein